MQNALQTSSDSGQDGQAKQLQHIMMVEDESEIQVIAQMALEDIGGFQVTLCDGGQQALDIINQPNTSPPDLILLDVMMPDLDGPATLAALRHTEHAARIPIIFMTGKSQPEEIAQLMALDAIGLITKPFDPISLADQVQALFDENT